MVPELVARVAWTPDVPAGVDHHDAVGEVDLLREMQGTERCLLLVLAGISATAILPASRLPRYRPGEIPDPSPEERVTVAVSLRP